MAETPIPAERADAIAKNSTSDHKSIEHTIIQHEPDIDVSKVEAVYRKIDRRLIPPFWILYFLCSAIRSNIGLAQTMNFEEGHSIVQKLGLTPKQTSTALALFYVAYVVFDLPSNLMMTRVSPRVWMSRIVLAVGIIGSCFTAVKAAWSLFLLRFLLGLVTAGMWPGMAFYLTLFYPPSRIAKRIGMYFTASQVSASVVGLVSAGFQKMDGDGGLLGYQWMFLLWGLVAVLVGFLLLWWLPDRPLPPGTRTELVGWRRWLPRSPPALKGESATIHYHDMRKAYHPRPWALRDVCTIILDWRLWPLTLMYFGVVGVGIGTQLYGTIIIRGIDANFTSIDLSLLIAPIWVMDLIAILLVTPLSDRFHRYRAPFFSAAVCIQIIGLLTTTFAPTHRPWARYGGLLMVGFGLGPTVPICMTWTNEIFRKRYGELGSAAATALVSGLGNTGSIFTTYALYTGWSEDAKKGPHQYRKSNLTMIGILSLSIISSFVMFILLKIVGNPQSDKIRSDAGSTTSFAEIQDGATKREEHQRGFSGLWRKK